MNQMYQYLPIYFRGRKKWLTCECLVSFGNRPIILPLNIFDGPSSALCNMEQVCVASSIIRDWKPLYTFLVILEWHMTLHYQISLINNLYSWYIDFEIFSEKFFYTTWKFFINNIKICIISPIIGPI